MTLAQYVPALEWLGFKVVTFLNGCYISVPTGEYDRTYPDPEEHVNVGTLKEGASDHDNAQAIILILDAIEARGYLVDMLRNYSIDQDEHSCRIRGNHSFDYLVTMWGDTRTIAVLEAAKALHEKEGGNG